MSETAPIRPNLERALGMFRRAPESRLFAPLADAYRDGGQQEEAVRVLRAGLERHPRYVSAHVLLGICLRDLQRDDEAESVFARVLELDAENLVALRHRAEVARRRGSLDRAVELLRQVLEADPFDREVQADLGLLTTALERRSREARAAQAQAAPVTPPEMPMNWIPEPLAPAAAERPFIVPPPPAPPLERPFIEPPPPPPPLERPIVATPPPVQSPFEPQFYAPPQPAVPFERPFVATPPPAQPVLERPFVAPPPQAPPAREPDASEMFLRAPSTEPPWSQSAEPSPPVWTPPPASESPYDPQAPAPAPPPIDLRRVGRGTTPEGPAGPSPLFPGLLAAAEGAGAAANPPADPTWQVTRQDDRIIVSPWDTPVRGPIRSVEDRLWSEQRGGRTADAGPPVPPPPPLPSPAQPPPFTPAESPPAAPFTTAPAPFVPPAPPQAPPLPQPGDTPPSAEFATLTLARIYESQGYVQKALGIYDELHRMHPQDVEIATRLAALQRRLAGMPAGEPQAPASQAPPPPVREAFTATPGPEAFKTPPDSEWRLLDASTLAAPQETAERLRQLTREVRDTERSRKHTVVGTPPLVPQMPPAAANLAPPETSGSEPASEDLNRGHADFQRFLSYVRSLKP